MIIEPAKRTSSVKEYFFSRKQKELDALNAERAARGEDRIISLGIGAPDGMPPLPAIEALVKAAPEPGNHVYQNYKGLPVLRQAFADWYSRYYGVTLDPGSNIQPLVGSKEGILLISLTFVNPGDKVLVRIRAIRPTPRPQGWPVRRSLPTTFWRRTTGGRTSTRWKGWIWRV